MTTLQPLSNRIVIRADKVDTVSEGGILLPGAEKNKSDRGEVLAVGPGRLLDDGTKVDMTVQVGDRVVFSKIECIEIQHNGEELFVIIEDNVIGILK